MDMNNIIKGLLFGILGITLNGCSMMGVEEPVRQTYEILDSKYIDTVARESWKPLYRAKEGAESYDLPDGTTMTKLNFKGIVKSVEFEDYLNNILRKLLQHSPVSGVSARVLLIGDDAYGKLQATPDGIIIVPLRFLRDSESEDEIAWLLAHELSHIILTHHDSDWAGRYHDNLNTAINTVIKRTSEFMNIAEKFGDKSHKKDRKKMDLVHKSSVLIHEVTKSSLFPAWQRVQEDEADLLATDLCVLAGYSFDDADTVLNKLGQWAEASATQRLGLMDEYSNELNKQFDILKKPEDRLTDDNPEETQPNEEEFPLGLGAEKHEARPEWEQYLIGVGLKLGQKTAESLTAEVNHTHRDMPLRRANIAGYTTKFYPEVEIDPDFESWEKQQNLYRNKSLLAAYSMLWDAKDMLVSSGSVADEQQVNAANNAYPLVNDAINHIDRRLKKHSYSRWLFYTVRSGQGKKAKATQNLQLALKDPAPSSIIFKLLINEKIENNQYSEAKRLMDRLWREFNKPSEFYPLNIKINKLARHPKTAKKYYDQCQSMAIDESIKQSCTKIYNERS